MFDELISAVTDTAAFSESLHSYLSHFSFNSAIILIMMIFMVVGAVDKIRGNRNYRCGRAYTCHRSDQR